MLKEIGHALSVGWKQSQILPEGELTEKAVSEAIELRSTEMGAHMTRAQMILVRLGRRAGLFNEHLVEQFNHLPPMEVNIDDLPSVRKKRP